VISFVPEKFVQNMVRIVKNVHEEIVVHVSNQLRRCGIVGDVQTKLDSTSYYYFEQLLTAHSPAIPKKFILKISRKIYNYPIPKSEIIRF